MSKKVYFAGSIRGSQDLQEIYPFIIDSLKLHGFDVLTEHLNWLHNDQLKSSPSDEDIFFRDVNLINEADVLIAEVSAPSHGVGWEICYAQYVRKIPVYVIYHSAVSVSAMLNGNVLISLSPQGSVCKRERPEDIELFIKKIAHTLPGI